MRHTWKNAQHLEKCTTLGKKAPLLKKCGTLKKMRHTWKDAPHLKRCAPLEKKAGHKLGKMRQTLENAVSQTQANAPHSEKNVTLGKMRQIWKIAPQWKKIGLLPRIKNSKWPPQNTKHAR